MTCPNCQHANPPGSSFCLGCGAHLALACDSCAAPLPAGSRFCNKCGTQVTAEGNAPPRLTSPEAYTPKHLAEKILTSKGALEGERKQVTVLFADLKGSMELLADRDPEEAAQLLDPVLERMMEAVHRYEGTVNQVMGDGIMALFGAPLAHEDHAVRACYAALRMQEAVKQHAEGVRRRHGVTRPDPRRAELRRGASCAPSAAICTWTTRRSARRRIWRRAWSSSPSRARSCSRPRRSARRGLRRGEAARARAGEGAGRAGGGLRAGRRRGGALATSGRRRPRASRGSSAATPSWSSCAGRCERARAGHGQVVALVGEPGVGKSRLVWEFTHSHSHAGLAGARERLGLVRQGDELPAGDRAAQGLLRDRGPRRAARDPREGDGQAARPRPRRSSRRCRRCSPCSTCRWTTPRGRRSTRPAAPAHARRRQAPAAAREPGAAAARWSSRICTGSTPRPRRCSTAWSRACRRRRLLLLVNYRPEYQHGWGSKTLLHAAAARSATPASADELLARLLGDRPEPGAAQAPAGRADRRQPVLPRGERPDAGGDEGRWSASAGAIALTQPRATLQVPATVQAVLAARIDRLPPEDKRLLQAAAVIGKDVPVRAAAGHRRAARRGRVARALARLQAAEFLYETASSPSWNTPSSTR